MAASQVLKNTLATLEVTFSVGNADGAVTVTVTRADGTAVVTAQPTTPAGGGRYTYALAAQSELDSLTATWSGTFGGTAQSVQTFAEIVGGYLFALTDLRNFGDKALNDLTKYPDADLREARARITDLFENCCQASFIPRFARDTLDGTGTSTLFLKNKRASRLIAVTVDGTALSQSDRDAIKVYPTGRLERLLTWSTASDRNVVVAYEYGWPSVPADVSRAALVLCRYELVSNDVSDRMVSFDNELGSVRLSVPGRNNPTGIPLVDATLGRYDETDVPGP